MSPLPAAYTEDALAAFVVRELGDVATQLQWVAETPRVAEAVLDALGDYGVTVVADATDVRKIRALARVAAWRAAVAATTGNYAISVEGMSFDRARVHDHAVAMLAEAERQAAGAGAGPRLLVSTVARDSDSDPYAAHPSQWGMPS